MAVVRTVGNPNVVIEPAAKALYGAVYPLKFVLKKQGIPFTVEPLRARWPDAHLRPKDEWTALWALPVPDDTLVLTQKDPDIEVRLEDWTYGTVAELLHIGPYDAETENILRLHAFITEQGYAIAGDHEEEYLTSPKAKRQKTIIRYPVRRV
jgi:hypothetical protein